MKESANTTALAYLHASSLDEICFHITQNNSEIKEEYIGALYKLYGSTLFKALELVDKAHIELITINNTNRKYFMVQGTKKLYMLYERLHFCQCDVFKSNFENKKFNVICRHILACKLAVALKRHKCGTAPKFISLTEEDDGLIS